MEDTKHIKEIYFTPILFLAKFYALSSLSFSNAIEAQWTTLTSILKWMHLTLIITINFVLCAIAVSMLNLQTYKSFDHLTTVDKYIYAGSNMCSLIYFLMTTVLIFLNLFNAKLIESFYRTIDETDTSLSNLKKIKNLLLMNNSKCQLVISIISVCGCVAVDLATLFFGKFGVKDKRLFIITVYMTFCYPMQGLFIASHVKEVYRRFHVLNHILDG